MILFFIVIASAVWMCVDSYQLGYKKEDVKGLAAIGPLGWLFSGLLLWIVAFPLYLLKRHELKEAGAQRAQQLLSVSGGTASPGTSVVHAPAKPGLSLLQVLGYGVVGIVGLTVLTCSVGIVGAMASKDDTSLSGVQARSKTEQSNVPGAPHDTQKPEPAVRESEYRVGDEVNFSDSSWVVLTAKDAGKRLKSNNPFQEAAETDGRFILVTFSVVNKTPKEERILDEPVLVDSKRREFRVLDEQMFYIPEGKKILILESLPPSIKREFHAVYEVASDARDLKFAARELAFAGDRKLVRLDL